MGSAGYNSPLSGGSMGSPVITHPSLAVVWVVPVITHPVLAVEFEVVPVTVECGRGGFDLTPPARGLVDKHPPGVG